MLPLFYLMKRGLYLTIILPAYLTSDTMQMILIDLQFISNDWDQLYLMDSTE
jgi:hypothetical protein